MLFELVHYKHLNISARVITFVTITQHDFVLYAFTHYKSIFLCSCVITQVTFKCPFLQLFVISIKVRSQSILFGTHVLALVTIYHLFCLLFIYLFIWYEVYVYETTRVKTLFPLGGRLDSPALRPTGGSRAGLMQLSTVKPCPKPRNWAAALLPGLSWFGELMS